MNFDYIIIGGGIAGLNAALRLSKSGRVLVVTKEKLRDCNTLLAQGGIAACIGYDDTPELHLQDTLNAGDGLCNAEAVKVLVKEGPDCIRDLTNLGMKFDTTGTEIALTREGAHSRNRILHAGGDATGKLIWEALAGAVFNNPQISIWEHTLVADLIVMNGVCLGVYLWENIKGGQLRSIRAKAVLLAAGGAGRLYPVTTNPLTATGDGMAMAYRAGAELSDMEFIQFHPTALAVREAAGFLVSEAVRGEGGMLRNKDGERFMPQYHPLEELAPRDVVARAIHSEMKKSGENHVFLDVTHFEQGFFARRFPQINQRLMGIGINPEKHLIPIAPAAHYMMGGVKTGFSGETNIEGLFAAGEVACTGVHGANRLASNSLLDGLVFSSRATELMSECPSFKRYKLPVIPVRNQGIRPYDYEMATLMQKYVGIVREEEGLKKAVEIFSSYAEGSHGIMSPHHIEHGNLGLLAYLCASAALLRKESRGGHYRDDFPHKKEHWVKHITLDKGVKEEMACL